MDQGTLDHAHLQAWIGKTETHTETLCAVMAEALAAVLDQPDAPRTGEPLPPLWHWIYFWSIQRQSELGPDGHPKRGGFLPPVPLPRRMWAGGRLRFHAPLPVGAVATRSSRILDVTSKQGKSGALVFVTVRHEILHDDIVTLAEEHDIVYRDAPQPGAPAARPPLAPAYPVWRRTVTPDAVLLFRYSALTFNGHRIHYDRSYATQVEGYPGLIVHGPLIATLLVDLLRRQMPQARLTAFDFRAISPLFDTETFEVCGRPEADGRVTLWAQNARGELAMQAEAQLDL
jgi:3-methylfumaryl-CoA hydratase